MGSVDERISAEFAAWEQRGRGWRLWPEPVSPEPAFQEFTGYRLAEAQAVVDDGRRPSFLASFFDSIQARTTRNPRVTVEEIAEPEPAPCEHPLAAELVASLPAKVSVADDAWRAFLDSLDGCAGSVAFELFGRENGISLQFAASSLDAPLLQRQLNAFVPDVPFIPSVDPFSEAWAEVGGTSFIVEFGLDCEFMLPLQTKQSVDPFVGLVAALSEVQQSEAALFQVLFQPVRHAWPASIWNALTKRDGTMLFTNIVPLIPGTKEKLAAPLFGVVLRLAAQADTFERSAVLVQNMARSLRVFARPENNHLIPLTNEGYPFELHEEDLINRQSRRSGMLLNREELAGFVHLPSEEVRSSKLRRQSLRSKAAPVSAGTGLLLGHNEHAGRTAEVRLGSEQRVRHMHLIGASGTGKSTLLYNLIRQDIENGEGLAVLDPHGDLVDRVLGIIPPERVNDVVLLDPTDEEYSVGFNILSAHSDFEKNLLASDLVSIFRRLSTSWGDQLNSVLSNAILAFLESSRGGTLADLRRFLLDADFRKELLETVRDPDVVFYWQKAFPQLGGNKSIGPVLTRLDTFLGPKPIRYLVSQKENKLDFANILDSGKIFLAKLPQGQIGKENSYLLGSLLVSKFQQLAMSRQRMSQEARRDFWLYIDEFHSFITPSMAEILAGARKYRVGLILAHQEMHQLQRDAEVASAIANCATRIVFRVGDSDAHSLEKGFSSFGAKDLQNLETGEAICRIGRSEADFNVRIPLPEEVDPAVASEARINAVTSSREKYATARGEIEAGLVPAAEPLVRPLPRKKAATPTKEPLPPAAVSPLKPDPLPKASEPVEVPIALPTVEPPKVELRPEPPVPVTEVPPEPRDLGRGGDLHVALQKRLQEEAQKLGFGAYVERQLRKGSNNAADVILKRGDFTIGVEFPVEGSLTGEFRNVKKCLKAGFSRVAVVSLRRGLLKRLEEAVRAGFEEKEAAKVTYQTPEEFLVELRKLASELPAEPPPLKPNVEIIGNYEVESEYPEQQPEERTQWEKTAIRVITDIMRQPPPQ